MSMGMRVQLFLILVFMGSLSQAETLDIQGPLKEFWAKASQTKKIEDAIALLPPELKRNVTFVYTSRSLQGATFQEPRAITFSEKGDFIVSFNGSHRQKGGSALEVLQFLKKDSKNEKSKFEMFEIIFDKDGTQSPILSEKNPTKCLVCHGNTPRPIWALYGDNSGVYGTSNASSFKSGHLETKSYAEFSKVAWLHDRYKHLAWPEDIKSATPKESSIYWPYFVYPDNIPYEDLDITGWITKEPNIRLNLLLSANRAVQIADEIYSQPLFSLIPYTFLRTQKCDLNKSDAKALGNWLYKNFGDYAPRAISSERRSCLYRSLEQVSDGSRIQSYQDLEDFRFSKKETEAYFFKPAHIRALFGFGNGDLTLATKDTVVVGASATKIYDSCRDTTKSTDFQIYDRHYEFFGNTGIYMSLSAMVIQRLLYLLEKKPLIGDLVESQKLRYGFNEVLFKGGENLTQYLLDLNVAAVDDKFLADCSLYEKKSKEEIGQIQGWFFKWDKTAKATQNKIFASVRDPLLESYKFENTNSVAPTVRFGCIECHSKTEIAPYIDFAHLPKGYIENINFRINSDNPHFLMPRARLPLTAKEKAELIHYLKSLNAN